MTHAYFAICPRGLESATGDELRRIGATGVAAAPAAGGVAFEGDLATGYAANLHSRLASRVLRRIDVARYRNDDDLYKLAARTPWESLIDPHGTLRVDVTASRSPLRSLNFATLRIKDGIVDRLRARTGDRPSIDTRRPDTRVFAYLDDRHATLYIDLSGEPLFKRGWRAGEDDKGEAPLKENLAAGLLALAGWHPGVPLYDPFCGSGTIVIEAAQIAAGLAPGLNRGFAFERLPDFDAATWQRLRDDARRGAAEAAARPDTAPIAASDVDLRAVAQVRRNAQAAGLPDGRIAVTHADALAASPPWPTPGLLLANPPYGERIDFAARAGPSRDGDDLRALGDCLRHRFAGWSVWLLSSDRDMPRRLGMKERRKIPLFNGPIECRLFAFDVFDAAARRETAVAAPTG